jgi:hypothetical protein
MLRVDRDPPRVGEAIRLTIDPAAAILHAAPERKPVSAA